MIRIVNADVTPALVNLKTNPKTNKSNESYNLHQVFPLDDKGEINYAKPPKKLYPICSIYGDSTTPVEDIANASISTVETVYPNKNSSVFCKINQVDPDNERAIDEKSNILIIPIPYRGSLSAITLSNPNEIVIKKGLIVSTTPFKYMNQKCEFNKILYLIAVTALDTFDIAFKTTAIHRDEKSDKVDLYTRYHEATITCTDGKYILSKLEITSQSSEKVNAADLTNDKKAINDIVDVAVDDIQKADEKPNKYNSKPSGNREGYKKNYDSDKKPYAKQSHYHGPAESYKSSYKSSGDSSFHIDFMSREKSDRNRKANKRLSKSKSKYDY